MAVTLQDIPVGAKAEIEKRSEVSAQDNRLFVTRIDSTDPYRQEIRILAPLDMLAGFRIHSNETFRLFFHMKDMLFQAWCVCLGYERSNQTILMVARLADKSGIENANRRNDFRVKTIISVDIWRGELKNPLDPPKLVPDQKPLKCLSADISSGGLGLVLTEALVPKELVLGRMTLEKGEIQGTILFHAEAVRITERDKSEAYPFAAGLRFCAISQAHESLLLKFALACQREALRMRTER